MTLSSFSGILEHISTLCILHMQSKHLSSEDAVILPTGEQS